MHYQNINVNPLCAISAILILAFHERANSFDNLSSML